MFRHVASLKMPCLWLQPLVSVRNGTILLLNGSTITSDPAVLNEVLTCSICLQTNSTQYGQYERVLTGVQRAFQSCQQCRWPSFSFRKPGICEQVRYISSRPVSSPVSVDPFLHECMHKGCCLMCTDQAWPLLWCILWTTAHMLCISKPLAST